jgi:hypothetical protein
MTSHGTASGLPGALRVVAAPAALPGANAVVTVPARTRWLFLSATLVLTTDANVANRIPTCVLASGSISSAGTRVAPVVANTASDVTVFSPGQPVAEFTAVAATYDPMPPPLPILAGATISTSIAAIQATDQVDLFAVYVEEWIDP